MNHRVTLLVLIILLALFVVPARAAGPAGPRLAISVFSDGPGGEDERQEVITVGPSGGDQWRLTGGRGAAVGESLSWSAEGDRLAFSVSGVESTAEEPFGSGWPVVAVVEADGSHPRAFPRAFLNAGDPIISPDGHAAYFARAKLVKVLPGRENFLFKSSIWSLNVADGSVRQRTKWRPGFPLVPSSVAPDGLTLAGTRYGRRGFEAVAIDLRSRRVRVLAREASEPAYSPDGSQIAFVRWKNWRGSGDDDGSPPINELRVTRLGTFPRSRLLLRSRKLLAWPGWDPSGSRLAFTSSHVVENGYSSPERGDKVMAINADGTCLTRVFTDPEITVYGSAWQPGPGRGAGPISC